MAYDATQSKTALEAGPLVIDVWQLQNTDAVHWNENNFSLALWSRLYIDSIICDWTTGNQFAPMMPQVGSGGGDTTVIYNNGFNNGFVIGMRVKRR
jgi:hypothetical protein